IFSSTSPSVSPNSAAEGTIEYGDSSAHRGRPRGHSGPRARHALRVGQTPLWGRRGGGRRGNEVEPLLRWRNANLLGLVLWLWPDRGCCLSGRGSSALAARQDRRIEPAAGPSDPRPA